MFLMKGKKLTASSKTLCALPNNSEGCRNKSVQSKGECALFDTKAPLGLDTGSALTAQYLIWLPRPDPSPVPSEGLDAEYAAAG
jgi:hypothetical protein